MKEVGGTVTAQEEYMTLDVLCAGEMELDVNTRLKHASPALQRGAFAETSIENPVQFRVSKIRHNQLNTKVA